MTQRANTSWGEIAWTQARKSRHTDQLPPHAVIETWPDCGHMVMWDTPQQLIAAALTLRAG